MKGVSTVIATLLLLVITMALATLAFTFLQGAINQQTAVVLHLDPDGQQCLGNNVIITVQNSGTSSAGAVSVFVVRPDGGQVGSCTVSPNPLPAQSTGTCTITRTAGPAGTYGLRATSSGDTTTGIVSCSSAV